MKHCIFAANKKRHDGEKGLLQAVFPNLSKDIEKK
jgi:hypothetical protein